MSDRREARAKTTVNVLTTDDHTQCTLVVVQEVNGTWVLYLHVWDRFGVRLNKGEAVKAAQAILHGVW